VVDGDEVGAHGKGALDHHLGQRRDDRRLDVAATKHGLANGHEVRDRMVPIANELCAFRMRRPMRLLSGNVPLGGYSQ
jgi:hypothetical protein